MVDCNLKAIPYCFQKKKEYVDGMNGKGASVCSMCGFKVECWEKAK